jgi:hypothetical protein
VPSNGVVAHVPGKTIRNAYVGLGAGAGVLMFATALSDLRVPIVDNPIGRQLDLKQEGNLAVWYSSAVLLMGAVAAFAVGQRAGAAAAVWREQYVWTLIALFFLGLSVDETARLHEQAGRWFSARVGTIPLLTEGGHPVFAWLVLLLPLAVVFVACMLAVLRSWHGLAPRGRTLVAAGLACWVGVLLAELVQAQLFRWSWDRSLQGVVEEGLELTGATLFLAGFVECLRPMPGPEPLTTGWHSPGL